MKSSDFKNIRKRFGMEQLQFARLIGYTGTDRNCIDLIRKYENGKKQVPLYIARHVWLIERFRDLNRFMPQFPDWPGYEFDSAPDPQHQKEVDDAVDR